MHSVTDRPTDRQTDGQQAADSSRSYCVAVRSANYGRIQNQRSDYNIIYIEFFLSETDLISLLVLLFLPS